MGTFLRYLMAFAVQLAWQRTGKSGATPPMRIPFGKNKDKSMPLPIIGPWQMMVAMWLARQVWAVYGRQVKTKLQSTNHPVANHIGNILPDTGNAAGSTPAPAQATPAQNTPIQTAPAVPATTPPAQAPRPTPQYGTRPLDAPLNGSGNLPPGSVLSSLRKTG